MTPPTAGRSQRKLDIVVRDSRRGLIAIGEAMSSEVIGHGHLSQLREAVNLLRAQSHLEPGVQPVLLLFSGAGFTPGLVSRGGRGKRWDGAARRPGEALLRLVSTILCRSIDCVADLRSVLRPARCRRRRPSECG